MWAFRGYDPVPDYPKSISTFGLPTTVAGVDAALYDEQSGKISFFAGSMHYRCAISKVARLLLHVARSRKEFNFCLWFSRCDEAKKTMDEGFPKRIDQTFPDIPGKVTAAFAYRGEDQVEPLGGSPGL